MRDVREWEESDLDVIVQANEKENVSLDYKASQALHFGDRTPMSDGRPLGEKHREDLIRDVSSIANAEGGRIIYGIKEKAGGYPKKVDDGIDQNVTHADRIEQILTTNIHPRIEGLFIKPVELKSKGAGKYGFVICIPKATTNAPHQADDKVYYKRHDATKLPMDDHEIRDMVGRSLEFGRKFGISWDLLIEVRRIFSAATERSKIEKGQHLPRTSLYIAVSQSLRTSGVAVMALPRALRQRAAKLINDVDRYNSIIETVDPGQREEARLTEPLRALLGEIIANGDEICSGLLKVLEDEPR